MNWPNLSYEKKLWKMGYTLIGGIDELGRGSFAGPVVAATAVFAPNYNFSPSQRFSGAGSQISRLRRGFGGQAITNGKGEKIVINDSKKMTEKQRELASTWIKENAICWGIGEVSAALINRVGMAKATRVAMRRAVKEANKKLKGAGLDYLLLDAFYLPFIRGLPKNKKAGLKGVKNQKDGLMQLDSKSRQLAIIDGDEKSLSIAAGSIIAKVYRDTLMKKIGIRASYKKYDWVHNKGYGTKKHLNAIIKYGVTRLHRKQFVQSFLENSHHSSLTTHIQINNFSSSRVQ